MGDKENIPVKQAAELLDTSPAVIYQWLREGRFPLGETYFRLGRKILFNRRGLEAWKLRGGTAAQSNSDSEAKAA